jgi:Flp pilus assembly protein TadG
MLCALNVLISRCYTQFVLGGGFVALANILDKRQAVADAAAAAAAAADDSSNTTDNQQQQQQQQQSDDMVTDDTPLPTVKTGSVTATTGTGTAGDKPTVSTSSSVDSSSSSTTSTKTPGWIGAEHAQLLLQVMELPKDHHRQP